ISWKDAGVPTTRWRDSVKFRTGGDPGRPGKPATRTTTSRTVDLVRIRGRRSQSGWETARGSVGVPALGPAAGIRAVRPVDGWFPPVPPSRVPAARTARREGTGGEHPGRRRGDAPRARPRRAWA